MSQENPIHLFEAEYFAGLEQLPDLIDMGMYDTPLPLDPGSLGMSDRTYDQLSSEELEIAGRAIMKQLGVDKNERGNVIRTYRSIQSPEPRVPGTIDVTVYRTKYSDQDLVLQELTFADNRTYWIFGPDQDI